MSLNDLGPSQVIADGGFSYKTVSYYQQSIQNVAQCGLFLDMMVWIGQIDGQTDSVIGLGVERGVTIKSDVVVGVDREMSSGVWRLASVAWNDDVNRTDERLVVVARGNDNIRPISSRSFQLRHVHRMSPCYCIIATTTTTTATTASIHRHQIPPRSRT